MTLIARAHVRILVDLVPLETAAGDSSSAYITLFSRNAAGFKAEVIDENVRGGSVRFVPVCGVPHVQCTLVHPAQGIDDRQVKGAAPHAQAALGT